MKIVFIIFFIIFALAAVYFFIGKGTEFILGRSARDENGKPRYRMKKLSRVFGMIISGLALSAFLGFLGFSVKNGTWLVFLAPVLFVVCLAAFLFTVSGVDKYKISNRRHRYRDDD